MDAERNATERRPYLRDTEENRRESLIQATQSLVSEGGPQAATVRAIAARAGVTPGLIRHYFNSKEELFRAAYVALMDGMTARGSDALESVGAEPVERLAAFVAASLRPPVLDAKAVGLWAGYLHQVRLDKGLLAMHESSYLHYRNKLESLIADLGVTQSAVCLRQQAVACNAVIDGLWLEGSMLPDGFNAGEIVRIGLRSVGKIINADLFAYDRFIPEIGQASPEERAAQTLHSTQSPAADPPVYERELA